MACLCSVSGASAGKSESLGDWQLGLQSSGGNITPMSRVYASCWLDPQLRCQPEHLCVTFPFGFSTCLSLNFLRSQQLGSKGIKWKYTTFFCLSLRSHTVWLPLFSFGQGSGSCQPKFKKGGHRCHHLVRVYCNVSRWACVLWLSLESQGSKG